MRVKIHREGTNILIILMAVLLLINLPLWIWCLDIIWLPITVLVISTIFYLLVANFFRSPHRDFPGKASPRGSSACSTPPTTASVPAAVRSECKPPAAPHLTIRPAPLPLLSSIKTAPNRCYVKNITSYVKKLTSFVKFFT